MKCISSKGLVIGFYLTSLGFLAILSPRQIWAEDRYLPNLWQHVICIKEQGGCAGYRTRDGGVPSTEDLVRYSELCRSQSHYAGSVLPEELVNSACHAADDWNDRNRNVITGLRAESSNEDVEALARMFEDSRILGTKSPNGRMDAVLAAMERPDVPGSKTGVFFGDEGFYGDQRKNGCGFRDPHPKSRNQVGHFLTAVGLGYDPDQIYRTKWGVSLSALLGVSAGDSSQAVAIRLIVGHEKAPDPDDRDNRFMLLQGFLAQFHRATDSDIQAFLDAEAALADRPEVCQNTSLDLKKAEPFLRKIEIHPDWQGNSIQDLRLSLMGWHLGRMVRAGCFTQSDEIGRWLRKNLAAHSDRLPAMSRPSKSVR